MVVYRSSADGKYHARPKAMFLDEVEKDGLKVPRFKKIKPPRVKATGKAAKGKVPYLLS
jgi:hypothetical protein